MNPNVRRKLTAFLFVCLIMGGVLVYAETLSPTLLDFPNALLNIGTIDSGQGAGELYGMDQDVKTTDAVTFATIDTGQGANELYNLEALAPAIFEAVVTENADLASLYPNYFYIDGTDDHVQVKQAIDYVVENYGMGTTYLAVSSLSFGGKVDFNGSGEKGWKVGIERGVTVQGRGRFNGTNIYPSTNEPCFYLTNAPRIRFIDIKFNGSKVAMTEPFIHGDSQDLAVQTDSNNNFGFCGVIRDCYFRGGPSGRFLVELENPQDWAFEGINQFYVKEGGAGAILINGTNLCTGNRGDGVSSGYTHIWLDSENSIAVHVLTHPSAASSINFLWWDNLKLGLRGNEAKDNLTGMRLEGITNCRFDIISEHLESVAQLYDCERIDITGEVTSFLSDATALTPAFDAWNPYPVMFYADPDCVEIDIGLKNIFVRNGYTTLFVDQSSIQKRNTIFHDTVILRQSASAYITWNVTSWTTRINLSGSYGRSEHYLSRDWDISDGTTLYVDHYLMETPQAVFVQGRDNETRAIYWKSGATNSTHICLGIPWVVTGDNRPFVLKATIDKN